MLPYLLGAYAALSVIAFTCFGIDKRKAQKKRFRTRETVLLGLGFFGGAIGALLAMNLFRHKTRHWYFWAINLLGLAWQAALAFYLL